MILQFFEQMQSVLLLLSNFLRIGVIGLIWGKKSQMPWFAALVNFM